jgi:hypothetical protein
MYIYIYIHDLCIYRYINFKPDVFLSRLSTIDHGVISHG